MTTRAYDYILQLADASNYSAGNTLFGVTTNAYAEIVEVDGNNVKVIMGNVYSEFLEGESIVSQSAQLLTTNTFSDLSDSIDGLTNTFSIPVSYSHTDSVQVFVDDSIIARDKYVFNDNSSISFKNVNTLSTANSVAYEETIFPSATNDRLIVQVVTGNLEAYSFVAANLISHVETANSTLTSIYSAPYIAEKNSTQQTPLVKLYTIYYPGEWYPPNENGNPSKTGDGYPWPKDFPLRYAEVVGETFNDFSYYISFGGEEYKVIALQSSDLSFDLSATIGTVTLEMSNFDGSIASLVENQNIAGYNSSNSTLAVKNGELVTNIDPRTVVSNVHFNQTVSDSRGANVVWDYSSTQSHGDSWIALKNDSRDLLGAVVELKLSYAKFLDYWPEFSTVRSSTTNSAQVYSTVPYRVGDVVTSNSTSNSTTVTDIKNSNVFFSDSSLSSLPTGSKLLIVNPDADKNSYIQNTFNISRLNELSEVSASFELSDWLQNFRSELPRRKFYKTTCPWKYKGAECKYPINGSLNIVGSNPAISANGFFTYDNEPTVNQSEDVCSKTLSACRLRNNLVNFGGFPGVKEE